MTVLRFVLFTALGIFLAGNTTLVLRRGYFKTRGGLYIPRAERPYSFWTGISIGLLASLFLLVRAIQIMS